LSATLVEHSENADIGTHKIYGGCVYESAVIDRRYRIVDF
jgi:hypothetical protein